MKKEGSEIQIQSPETPLTPLSQNGDLRRADWFPCLWRPWGSHGYPGGRLENIPAPNPAI